MLNPGLLKLLQLRYFAVVRQGLRQFRRPQRAILMLLGIAMFGLWLAPSILRVGVTAHPPDPEKFRAIAPFMLMVGCLMPLLTPGSRQAFQFTAAEIDFLFPGPFTRRELLATKLITTLPALLFAAIMFSVFLRNMVPFWLAGVVGCLLSLLLVQLFGLVALLVQQIATEYARSQTRKIVVVLLVVLVATAAGPLLVHPKWDGILALCRAPLGRAIAMPFAPFVRTMSAQSIGELLAWGGVSLAIDLALLAAAIRLDVNYSDVAIASSQAFYRRKKQMQQRGGAGALVLGNARLHCPGLPWLGGAGPIAQRQLTAALRGLPGLGLFLLCFAVPMLTMVIGSRHGEPILAPLAGGLIVFSIMLTRMVPFDFRGDLEQMDWLKSLPLSATAIAAGQLVTPVVLLTAFHLGSFTILGLLDKSGHAVLLSAAAFVVLVNLLVLAVDNLLFLLAPARLHPGTGVSFQFFGRAVVEMLAKFMLLAAGGAAAVGPAAAAYFLCGRSWIAGLAVAWVLLLAMAVAMLLAVAWAFRRFDVSLDPN